MLWVPRPLRRQGAFAVRLGLAIGDEDTDSGRRQSYRAGIAGPDFDLQSHSLHSDGALPVAEVVARAAAAGVRMLSLTDHDTVDGVDEALAAGRAEGVQV